MGDVLDACKSCFRLFGFDEMALEISILELNHFGSGKRWWLGRE